MSRERRPETLVLAASLFFAAVVLLLFYVDLHHAREREMDEASKRTHHFALMVAENTARAFEVVEVVLRELASELSREHQDWPKWPREQAWDYLAQRHSKSLAMVKSLNLYDARGQLQVTSVRFPAPRHDIGAEPYFAELRNGKALVDFGPYLTPDNGRYVYGLARRLDGPSYQFNGIVQAAIDPVYLQEFCWPARLAEDFEAVLVNATGRIVASCRPADLSGRSSTIGAPVDSTLFNGQLQGQLSEPGVHVSGGYVVAVTRVPAFPGLSVIAAVPSGVLLRSWAERRNELIVLAGLIIVFILLAGWYLRRHLQSSGEMHRQLAENQAALQARVAEATAELIEQRNDAERANRGKSRFLAAASHDLRQPLHALSLFSADLEHQVRRGEYRELPRLAEQIASSTRILGELLDALLDLSRLDVQGAQPEIVHFPLQAVFDRVAAAQRRSAVDKQMILRFRPTRLWLHSDPTMFERMVANLVANALRYTPSRGRVLVVARKRGDKVLVQVRDSGVGIPGEDQEAIFAEFYQVKNPAREHGKGLGLGLSIVDRLSRALGVEVGLRSRIGLGTSFSLLVDIGDPEAQETAPPPAVPTVYAIGDGEALRSALKMISGWEYPVQRHATLADCLAAAPGEGWVLGEFAVLDALAAQGGEPPLPVIALATPEELARVPGDLRGKVHLLPLPLRPAKLRALLRV